MTEIWTSEAARTRWRELLDTAAGTADVVITRRGEPLVAVIDYQDFMAMHDELDDLRAARRADAAVDEYLDDPKSARPWQEVRAELVAAGKLDATA